jgi:phenylacetate-CoA ligase
MGLDIASKNDDKNQAAARATEAGRSNANPSGSLPIEGLRSPAIGIPESGIGADDSSQLSSIETHAVLPDHSEVKTARSCEYWEEKTIPKMQCTTDLFRTRLELLATDSKLQQVIESAKREPEEVLRDQFAQVRKLIEFAYHTIPLYRDKYSSVGFEPGDLRTWEDYHRLPVVTKAELIEGFPSRNTDLTISDDALFKTRSSGSSGQTVRIHVDERAIIEDCIQGVQQFSLQTAGNYQRTDTIAHVYTVPWWVHSLNSKDDYPTVFISSLIKPKEIGRIISNIRPEILSLYPSNLESILPHIPFEVIKGLKLIVTHSEMSSPKWRRELERQLGVPVLDEYSSEELTRIAIELSDHVYRVCADAVVLSVLKEDGTTSSAGLGHAVGTNLLNRAMPFIRYVQGDLIEIAGAKIDSGIGWPVLNRIEGRQNDAFVGHDGAAVPAGTLLDITYRWQYENGLSVKEFELVQTAPGAVVLRIFDPKLQQEGESLQKSLTGLQSMLFHVMGPIALSVEVRDESFKNGNKKVRPIRREYTA